MNITETKSVCFLFVALAIVWCPADHSGTARAGDRIKVGIFQNKPVVYDQDGPKGLFVDVLERIADREGWTPEYVTCEFRACLSLLKSNDLDLMTSLGRSAERQKHFIYSEEAIWTFWGTVYTRERGISGILDLEGKKIGVRRKNKITTGLKTLIGKFGVSLAYSEYDNYEAAFDALENNRIDAVAVNNTYAFTRRDINRKFHKTPIVFDPFPAYFAVAKKGGNPDLLDTIDRHVKRFRDQESSVFDQFRDKWLGLSSTYWTTRRIVLLGGVLVLATAAVMSLWRYRSLVNLNQELKRNIAQRKLAQENLARVNEDLNIKNDELEQIVYVASHDLRSPLVNIDGYSRELEYAVEELNGRLADPSLAKVSNDLKPVLEEDIPEALKFIRTSVKKMERLLSGLLRLSRSGRAAITVDTLDMNHVMSKIVESSEYKIHECGAQVMVAELPACQSDAVQTDQIFTNLLDNALKYLAPDRKGVIRISGDIADGCSVYCVEDNGIGFDNSYTNKIFEIFHQLDPGANNGEGLGLTIVKRLLSRLEGEIRVESEPGAGSRFYVSLPKG